MAQTGLFGNYRYCEICKRPLPANREESICVDCKEYQLFSEVKDYIRANDVTEYDVADHFNIPHQKVKQWIREGRIEYKDNRLNTHITGNCQKCGTPILFGTLCTKCLKQVGMSGYGAFTQADANRMRFLEEGKR